MNKQLFRSMLPRASGEAERVGGLEIGPFGLNAQIRGAGRGNVEASGIAQDDALRDREIRHCCQG